MPIPDSVPELTTERLALRAWAESDGPRLVEAAHDPVLRHFIPETPLPTEPEAVAPYLARVRAATADGVRLAWCVADGSTGLALGNVALFDFEGPDGAGAAQLGYWAHPEARGRGVMTEAIRRVTDWALSPDGLSLRRVYLLTAAGNIASRRAAERAGFTHVGTERLGAVTAAGFDDNAIYDRLATDP